MKLFSLRILLVLSLLIGFGTVSSVGVEAASGPENVKIQNWKGHNFTFLPLSAIQNPGYEIFTEEQGAQGFQGDRSVRIPYTSHVGKEVTINNVVAAEVIDKQQEYVVHMTVNDTGEKLVGHSMRGQLAGLVLTSDLINAREQFLGKTVYPKFRELSGLYVPDAPMPAAVALKIGSPVTVVDVYAGSQSQEPIWLVVSVDGQKAVLPITYSLTNSPIKTWEQDAPWKDALFMEDPRSSLGGSQAVWTQIETGNIENGMTKAQVHLSWGKPARVDKNRSVWIYGTQKLTFDGDELHSIEALPRK